MTVAVIPVVIGALEKVPKIPEKDWSNGKIEEGLQSP